MTHTIFKSPFLYVLTAVCLVAAGASVGADKPTEAHQKGLLVTDELRSKDSRIIARPVRRVLSNRSQTIKELIALIEPSKAAQHSERTRAAAAFLLGELRASEAAPILAKALANESYSGGRLDTDPFDWPVSTALIKIGRPSIPALIENLETSDDRIVMHKSIDVVYIVLGGERRFLELLGKLEKRATDEQVRQRIRKVSAHVESHFKEDVEPLY